MKNIIIFGSGGHAKVILSEILKYKNKYNFFGFVDSSKRNGQTIIKINKKNYKVISIKKNQTKNLYGVIGIGDNYLRYKMYKKIIKELVNIKWETIISKNSKLSPNTQIAGGSVILGNSFIGTGTKIKEHCIINSSNSIDHDNFFENFSSTGPGVITGGNVKVDNYSHLGIGCVVKNNISIKENVICGGKSYINVNCKKNSIYIGTPCKFKKYRKLGDKYL
tara:strand:- start:247 stop:909 length:663 start_codon:yes stop_codon:yes gene_type:complete